MVKKNNKKAIAVVYSDHHVDIYNKDGERRLKDALDVMRTVKLVAKQFDIPTLFCGDLINKEKQISNKLLSIFLPFAKKIWSSKQYPTYAITGNHDQSEENTLEHISPSYIRTFSQIFKGLICIDNKSVTHDNLQLHGIPYLTHDIGLDKAIRARVKKINSGKVNILMLHTTLPGAKDTDGREVDSHIKSTTLKLLKKFDVVLVGHIHKPMVLGKNIYQVGAPNHQRKTDKDSQLGYCIIHSDFSVKYYHLPNYPKFIELEAGETAPDNKNYYYNKEIITKKAEVKQNTAFSDVSNRAKMAKGYLKEKGIKDKTKRRALINILKQDD